MTGLRADKGYGFRVSGLERLKVYMAATTSSRRTMS